MLHFFESIYFLLVDLSAFSIVENKKKATCKVKFFILTYIFQKDNTLEDIWRSKNIFCKISNSTLRWECDETFSDECEFAARAEGE